MGGGLRETSICWPPLGVGGDEGELSLCSVARTPKALGITDTRAGKAPGLGVECEYLARSSEERQPPGALRAGPWSDTSSR